MCELPESVSSKHREEEEVVVSPLPEINWREAHLADLLGRPVAGSWEKVERVERGFPS